MICVSWDKFAAVSLKPDNLWESVHLPPINIYFLSILTVFWQIPHFSDTFSTAYKLLDLLGNCLRSPMLFQLLIFIKAWGWNPYWFLLGLFAHVFLPQYAIDRHIPDLNILFQKHSSHVTTCRQAFPICLFQQKEPLCFCAHTFGRWLSSFQFIPMSGTLQGVFWTP